VTAGVTSGFFQFFFFAQPLFLDAQPIAMNIHAGRVPVIVNEGVSDWATQLVAREDNGPWQPLFLHRLSFVLPSTKGRVNEWVCHKVIKTRAQDIVNYQPSTIVLRNLQHLL